MGITRLCVIGKSAILRGHPRGSACGGGHQPSSNKGRLVFRKEGRIGHIIVLDDKGQPRDPRCGGTFHGGKLEDRERAGVVLEAAWPAMMVMVVLRIPMAVRTMRIRAGIHLMVVVRLTAGVDML
ncbi:MAG: hypothetical protein RLZ97_1622, partial [Verrucomicrobiota bacterium]